MAQSRLFKRALAEFTAITVGVLVALAIDAAWSARGDRLLEKEYLEQVVQEVESNAFRVEFTIERADWARDNLDRASNILDVGLPEDSADVFVASLANATSFMAAPIVSGAVLQDLVSTGNLRLIRDGELRQAILSMDAIVRGRVDLTLRAEAEVESGLEPLISRFIPPHVIWQEGAGTGLAVSVDRSPGAREMLGQAAGQIAGDPAFRRELNAEYRRIQRGREASESLWGTLTRYADRLRAMIQDGASRGDP
jgi:hypothetical protein